MQGTIQRLIRGKGFGFILAEGRQYFFHHSEVREIEFKQLTLGDVVEFQFVEDEGGRNPRAVQVIVTEKKERPPKPPPEPRARAPRRPAPRFRRTPEGLPAQRRSRAPTPVSPADELGIDPSLYRDLEGGGGDEEEEFVEEFASPGVLDEARPRPRRPGRGRAAPRGRDERSQRPRASGTPGARGEGVIRAIDVERGFGFIETPSGDIFFHRSGVRDDFEHLNIGARVVFVFGQGDRGSKAEDVSAV